MATTVLNKVFGAGNEPVGKDEKYGFPIYEIRKEEPKNQQGIPNGLEVYQQVDPQTMTSVSPDAIKTGKEDLRPKRDRNGMIIEINGEREEDFYHLPGGRELWKKKVKEEEEKELVRQTWKYKMMPWLYQF